MKRLIKWFLTLVFVLAAVVGLLLLFRNSIVQSLLEQQLRAETGMEVDIGGIDVGVRAPTLRIENLRIYNPQGFDRGMFVDIPAVTLEYDAAALKHRQLRLRVLRVDVFEIHFVRNREGLNNLQHLRAQSRRLHQGPPSWLDMEFEGIDDLRLEVGRFKYTDNKDSRSDELWLGIRNAAFKNVKSVDDLQPFITKVGREKNLKAALDVIFAPPPTVATPPPAAPAGSNQPAR